MSALPASAEGDADHLPLRLRRFHLQTHQHGKASGTESKRYGAPAGQKSQILPQYHGGRVWRVESPSALVFRSDNRSTSQTD